MVGSGNNLLPSENRLHVQCRSTRPLQSQIADAHIPSQPAIHLPPPSICSSNPTLPPSSLITTFYFHPRNAFSPSRFNFPLWRQSRARWRGLTEPEDIPLSFQQPFTCVASEKGHGGETNKRNKQGWLRKQLRKKSGTRVLFLPSSEYTAENG